MPKLKKAVCPRCSGTGIARAFNRSHQKYTDEQRKEAIALFDKGFTYRAIAEKMGFKHPQTAFNLIK